jgi:eukaryotic-like serine/threonine-protein kinase
MAPEQFRNAKNADARCDIYSLGATLYMMVTGELPFKSNGPLDAWMKKIQNELTPPRQLVPTLSERLDWAIMRAMSADPSKRPLSCREFVEDLTGHTTRRVPTMDSSTPLSEVWYLVYKDDAGAAHTVKGNVSAIRRSLKDGLLGDASNVRAARVKAGPFESLRGFPEFRDLVVTPAPMALPGHAPSTLGTLAQDGATPLGEPSESVQQVHIELGLSSSGKGNSDTSGSGWLMWLMLGIIMVFGGGLALWLMPLRLLLNR